MSNLSNRLALAAVAAALAAVVTSCATTPSASSQPVTESWYKVAISGSEEAFVDTNSLRTVGALVQAQVKQNYLAPKPAAKAGKKLIVGKGVSVTPLARDKARQLGVQIERE